MIEPEDDEPENCRSANSRPATGSRHTQLSQQENRRYFLSIGNVRTDKVSLETILDFAEVDVPTIDRVLFARVILFSNTITRYLIIV